MCGIWAIFGSAQDSNQGRQVALKMSKMLRHRGPDWNGLLCFDGGCILAHERLAIIGLHSGAQPITNKSGDIGLTVNGEIYNYKDLEDELKSMNPSMSEEIKSVSDCEVLLHLYEKKGVDFLSNTRIRGMYAFVLYDHVKKTILVARDPIGIIPLYIGWGNDGTSIYFASELKAIQQHCQHLESFPPGHYYYSNQDGSSTQCFFNDQWFIDTEYFPTQSLDLTKLRKTLTNAVGSHLLSEVPFGLLLSGGLDSSLIAAIAVNENKRRGNFDALKSFCIGLDGSPDIAAAEKVAKHIGTRHYSFNFTIQQGLDALSDTIYFLETFDVTTIRAGVPMMLLARRIKATGCKMVLSGEGADEAMAGYLYFHKAPNAEELQKETVRKLKTLHQYDCLRANKAMMAWGVETRVPFLDLCFLEYIMNLDPTEKMCIDGRIEKHAIRAAFDDKDHPYLPSDILWRQKEQFSDGVGYAWIDALKEHAESVINDQQMKFAIKRFPGSPPVTKEAYLYREMFDKHFPTPSAACTVPYEKSIACSTAEVMKWDVAFDDAFLIDPSGRSVSGIHVQSYKTCTKT